MTGLTDALGVEIRVGDTVHVVAWGWAVRKADVGCAAKVAGFTSAGSVRLEHPAIGWAIAGGRAVKPTCLAVARRDGAPGHEGHA